MCGGHPDSCKNEWIGLGILKSKTNTNDVLDKLRQHVASGILEVAKGRVRFTDDKFLKIAALGAYGVHEPTRKDL